MKVYVKRSCTVTLELDEREAEILCALVGGVLFSFDTEVGKVVYEIFNGLDDVLTDRNTSFSDFFEGNVRPIK